MTVSRTRVVVVGVGHMGALHLEKLMAHPAAQVVGIVDTASARREEVSQRFGLQSFDRVSAAPDADAAIVATTSDTHDPIARACLARGWHVLVEKPLALDLETCLGLVAAAQQAGRLLCVGHVERFNPAVQHLVEVARPPLYFVSERLGELTGRSLDIDVLCDLMVHDLDILLNLVTAPATDVRCIGVPVLTSSVDMASARVEFADGSVAQLSAGRASLAPSRKLRVFTKDAYLSVDCAAQTVKTVRRAIAADGSVELTSDARGETEKPEKVDALARQDAAFLDAILGRPNTLASGLAATAAMRLLEEIRTRMRGL